MIRVTAEQPRGVDTNRRTRKVHTLVVIHGGALTETLLESELFGHEPDMRGSKLLGELSVLRESLERVLRENPESLASILMALISALETHRNPIGAAEEEPEEDGVYALTEV